MNIVTKITGKLYRNFKILFYCFSTTNEERVRASKTHLMWHRTIAVSCGAYPVYFPRRREITDTFWGNIFLLTRFFVWMSYRNINQKLKKNNSVYVSLNEMGTFKKKVLPKIKIPFVLVTGDSDYPTSKFKDILKNRYIIHWFAQHNDIDNEKLTSMPAGLDFQSLVTQSWTGENMKSAVIQEKILFDIIRKKSKKELKIFSNFQLSYTNPRRRELYEAVKNNPLIYFQKRRLPRTDMWKLQKRFMFNLSPAGNGPDAHRTWESLLLGQIPIVEKISIPMDRLHEQFPIVIINSPKDITKNNLKKWHRKYSAMFTDDVKKKLTNEYWIGLIRNKQNNNS